MISLSVPPSDESDSDVGPDPIYLPCYNSAAAEFLYHYISPSEILQFDDTGTGWNHSLQHLTVPMFPPLPPIECGTLYWPSDMSRFAIAHLLVDDSDLESLRPILYSTDGPLGALLFIDEATTFSGDAGQGAANVGVVMFALPPRPLATCVNWTGQPITLSDGTVIGIGEPVNNSLHLLTLVDERYFAFMVGSDVLANDYGEESVTWSDWYDSVRDAIGIDPALWAADAVDAAFATPTNRYTARRQPLPMLLDAAAWQNGQRVCRHLSGIIDIQNFDTANEQDSIDSAKLANGASADAADGDFIPLAGGLFADDDLNRSVSIPKSVIVLFGDNNTGAFSDTPYTVTVNLADLALDEFAGVTGIEACQKVIVSDLTYDGTNASALDDYAAATAKAYYLWQLGTPDQVVSGIAAYDSNALIDSIKWTYNTGMCCTRIQRRRWNDRSQGMFRKSEVEGYLSAWPPDVDIQFVRVHLASATSASTPSTGTPSTVAVDNVDWIWVNGALHLDDGMGNTEDVTVDSVDVAGPSFKADISVTFAAPVMITGIQNSLDLNPARVEAFVGNSTAPTDKFYCWYKDANGNQPADLSYHWCEGLPDPVPGYPSTTVSLAIVAGTRTVTPASMTDILSTSQLLVDTLASTFQETVTVISIDATTFTAPFANAHGINTPIVGYLKVYQDTIQSSTPPEATQKHFVEVTLGNTDIPSPITSTGSQTVTVSSIANIYVGANLIIGQFTANQETVPVTAVSGSTLTANFTLTHLAGVSVTMTWDTVGNVPAIEATFVGDSTTPAFGANCWYSDTNQLIPIDGDFHEVFLVDNLVDGKKVYKDAIHPGDGCSFESTASETAPATTPVTPDMPYGPTREMELYYATLYTSTTTGGAIFVPNDASSSTHGVLNIDTGSIQTCGNGDKQYIMRLIAINPSAAYLDTNFLNHNGLTANKIQIDGLETSPILGTGFPAANVGIWNTIDVPFTGYTATTFQQLEYSMGSVTGFSGLQVGIYSPPDIGAPEDFGIYLRSSPVTGRDLSLSILSDQGGATSADPSIFEIRHRNGTDDVDTRLQVGGQSFGMGLLEQCLLLGNFDAAYAISQGSVAAGVGINSVSRASSLLGSLQVLGGIVTNDTGGRYEGTMVQDVTFDPVLMTLTVTTQPCHDGAIFT